MPLTNEQKIDRARKRQLAVALKKEARAKRLEARSQEWTTKGMYLSREETADMAPCRGCGPQVIDNLGDSPATMYLSPDERIEYEADQAQFRERHSDCDSHFWSMADSRAHALRGLLPTPAPIGYPTRERSRHPPPL